ncbi:hypothetical protein PCASD_04898 [Puccinia coronata f. sp. avenae]|uniref:Uncharacterized protein n=1 Tax=Puccinia coronata f. sp. avenae TaxID=200324 RepID=A0A2N5VD76_9BASI|nr:hypothetical protein PCASD_04898 [Puccinia coronata f. sp. avenae]
MKKQLKLDEEAIKIQTGRIGGSSPLTSPAALKQPAKKRAKKIQTTKPVNYLTKYTKTASSHQPLHPEHTNPGAAPNSQGAANSNPSQQDPPDNSTAPAVPARSHLIGRPMRIRSKINPNPPNALANHALPTNPNPSLASGQNGDNATAATASTGNDPTSALSQSLHANPHPSMSSDDPPNSSSTAPSNGDPTQPSQTSPKPLSILKSDDAKLHVILLYQEVEGSKPSWDNYQKHGTAWDTWSNFMPTSISSPPLAHIPLGSRQLPHWIPHPESTLVRFLYRLSHPPQASISEWAKVVAPSVELMAENLFRLPTMTQNHNDDELIKGLQVLQHINQIKNLSSSFATVEEDAASDSASTKRLHSVDVLNEFRNVILDVMAGYVIFQTHSLSPPPLSSAEKKANSCSNQKNAQSSSWRGH